MEAQRGARANLVERRGTAVGLGPVENEASITPDFIHSCSREIEVFGKRYPARAALRPLYDPRCERIRA